MRAEHGIEAESLVRTFKGDITAVDGIDLRVEPGEIYGFLGPNGAEVDDVHMLTTLLPPTSGTARVAGFDIVQEGPKVRSAIGAALQEAALDNLLTGREHLGCSARSTGSRARAQGAVAGAPRAGRAHAGRGPQGRRLLGRDEAKARSRPRSRAPAHDPLPRRADHGPRPAEPKRPLGEVARLAREEGVTVFLTTQYLEEADALADRVGIIDHGKIVAEGTPEQLKAQIGRSDGRGGARGRNEPGSDGPHPGAVRRTDRRISKSVAVRLEHGVEDLAGIVRALDAEGIKIEHLELHAPSLDDVFLAKTGRSLEGAAEEEEAEAEAEAR